MADRHYRSRREIIQEHNEIVRLYDEGASLEELAARFGHKKQTIYAVQRRGYKPVPPPPRKPRGI